VAASILIAAAVSPPAAGASRIFDWNGSDGAAQSQATQRFGKMFPNLPPFQFSAQAAADLVAAMEDKSTDPVGVDEGTAEDNPNLPAEYTYLGQFLDHDLDFDTTPQPSAPVNPNTLVNHESFLWDLSDVFGGGPSADPQLYAADHRHLLIQGTVQTPNPNGQTVVKNGNPNGVLDLPRAANGSAIIADPRDDENQILSQIDTAFITFYNDFVNRGMSYAQARQLTENYYQEIVLTDVLPHYVGQATIDRYLRTRQVFGHTVYSLNTPNYPVGDYTPIEFSVGAYRFGHALVRQVYHINDILPDTTDIDDNVTIFDLNTFQRGDLTGGGQLPGPIPSSTACGITQPVATQALCGLNNPAGHQITWRYFVPALSAEQAADGLPIDMASTGCTGATSGPGSPGTRGCGDKGINFARKTQTSIVPALFNLPASAIAGCNDAASPVCNGSGNLMSRDFARGEEYGLPSGQSIARAMGCQVIPAASINPTHDSVFDKGTPLLYYVLAEAQRAHRTLGCVGAGIVTQIFLRVLWNTPNSILRRPFTPSPSLVKIDPHKKLFSFGDLLVDTHIAPRLS
jgi:heme peroxidase